MAETALFIREGLKVRDMNPTYKRVMRRLAGNQARFYCGHDWRTRITRYNLAFWLEKLMLKGA